MVAERQQAGGYSAAMAKASRMRDVFFSEDLLSTDKVWRPLCAPPGKA